jgi:spore germination protein KA
MEIVFEALREAGIRLPGPANQTVGIVGVLVIGDASVRAGIVSPVMVVIIAITAIASFSIPSYDMGYTIRILRFVMLVLGAILGLYGIMLGILALLIHLASLRSFGVDYLSPIAPVNFKDLKDVTARFPWWAMNERPSFANKSNLHRQNPLLKPRKDNKS